MKPTISISNAFCIASATLFLLTSLSSCDIFNKKEDDPAAALEEKYLLRLDSPKDTRTIDITNDGSDAFDAYGPVNVSSDNMFSWTYPDMYDYGNSIACVGKVSSMVSIKTFEGAGITYSESAEIKEG